MRIRINFTGELLFVALSLFFVMSASAIVNAEYTIISTEEMKKSLIRNPGILSSSMLEIRKSIRKSTSPVRSISSKKPWRKTHTNFLRIKTRRSSSIVMGLSAERVRRQQRRS